MLQIEAYFIRFRTQLLWFRIEQRLKHFTVPAHLHLTVPISPDCSFTHSSVDKPAQTTGLKLPCRAFFSMFARTFLYNPARLLSIHSSSLSGKQEEYLPLHMTRHRSPSLLVAVYCLNRRSEQLGHLPLRLVQSLAKITKFLAVHGKFQEPFL